MAINQLFDVPIKVNQCAVEVIDDPAACASFAAGSSTAGCFSQLRAITYSRRAQPLQ
jgi:hypothetical protein